MKNIILGLIGILIIEHSQGQTFSGLSNPIEFKISKEQGKSSAVSEPISFNIRQGAIISGNSNSVEFNIRQKQSNNSSQLNQETNRSTNLSKSENSTIPELETNLPKYYSLIIGINDYQYSNEKLQDLNNPVNDASTLRKTLINKYVFQQENSIFLENPSRQQIIQQLETIASKITPKDNLLIFYAGHGVWDDRIKIGYWLPSDAQVDDKSTWLSNSTIRDYIAGIDSKHTLLITDACFSGSIFKTREVSLTDYAMSNLYRLQSRKAMTSGTLTTVPDESKFMQYFIKRLLDTEGKYISARQLFYGLETAVLNNTSTVPQFGVIQDTGDEGGDFIFIRRPIK
jgi:hypothetical protein